MSASAAAFRAWEIPSIATFEDAPGGLVRVNISTPLATAQIYLHGAHVALYQPAGAQPVLFMSGASHFAPGKAIRGGVPVIFPWFGARAGHPAAPAHGFARTLPWEVEALTCADGQTVTLVLKLAANETTRALWPHAFILRHRIAIGAQLEMTLEVENVGDEPFEFEEALHTYLAVAEVREISVSGLGGAHFLDKVDGQQRKLQDDVPIRITGETDRVYLDTTAACVLEDPGFARRITVEKSGSATTVVWNPWIAKAKAMADFGDDEWPGMMCIETANAADDAVTLPAGATHRMRAVIRL